jgi:transcriptional regulator with PAS, ATPase and Fis domain
MARSSSLQPVAVLRSVSTLEPSLSEATFPGELPGFATHADDPFAVVGIRILHCLDVALVSRVFPVVESLLLGSGERVDVVIADALVSPVHASIVRTREGFVLRDHQSANGTFLNGRRAVDVQVDFGAIIRVGHTLLHFGRQPRTSSPIDASYFMGKSLEACRLRENIAAVAKRCATVLITGETGTGKDLVARAIHAASQRTGPFIDVHCAISSFEDAGWFRAAEGGTLFLDEVGELSLGSQAKMLRALDECVSANVRVVASTNTDLPAKVASGRFRHDLLARLQGLTLATSPLRDRPMDILELFDAFAEACAPGVRRDVEFSEALVRHRWPMNVRELRSVAEQATLSETRVLTREQLPKQVLHRLENSAASEPSREELLRVLKLHSGNISHVASHFSKARKQVYRWMKKHGLNAEDLRAPLATIGGEGASASGAVGSAVSDLFAR